MLVSRMPAAASWFRVDLALAWKRRMCMDRDLTDAVFLNVTLAVGMIDSAT